MTKNKLYLFLTAAFRNLWFCTVLLFLSLPVFSQHENEGALKFIENKKQWEEQVKYKADLPDGAMFLEKTGFTFVFKDMKAISKLLAYKSVSADKRPKLKPSDYNIKCHAYKMNFLNAAPDVMVTAENPSKDYYNYFTSDDKKKWASKVRSFDAVTYKNLYKNIDLNLYENKHQLKYDVLLHPGANPANIQIQYEGVEKVYLNDGNLIVKTSVNSVTELSPIAYQMSNGRKTKIACKFVLNKNILTFEFPDGCDNSKEIIIDPTLIFSTYSGSTADNWGFTATYDSHGRVYSGGIAFGTGYPITIGAFQINFAGGETGAYLSGCDIAIIKYDSLGTQRLWATYLGGSRNELPHSMIVNGLDELVIYGTTGSSNFPITSGAYDQTFNGGDSISYDFNSIKFSHGIDIFVSKLSSDGTQLLASTYVGGTKNDGLNYPSILSKNYADGARGEVMVDANNNVYVASTTNSVNFPVTSGAFQQTPGGGGQDGIVFKMDANLSNMIWSTYLGGSGRDAAYNMVLDTSDNVYVTGGTTSTDFPVTAGVLHPAYMGGSTDGFITKISQNGNSILKSTYYGSVAYDQSYLIKSDKAGNIYVFGQTAATGGTFIYNALWATPNGGQFISKMNADLSSLIWSTAFGTGNIGPDISPTAFLVDLCNKIYLSGWGGPNINGFGGTNGLPITPGAFQTTTDNNDYYFLVISDDASSIIYGSYFGSPNAYEHVDGGTSRFDRNGRIYQSVCAGCGGWDNFPTTPGAWSNTNNSTNCNNAVIKFDFNLPITIADFVIPPVGCTPYNAFFQNTSVSTGGAGVSYYWTFGDGTNSTQTNPTHTYGSSGVYNVTLIVIDTAACNYSDTITKQVLMLSDSTFSLLNKTICSGDFTQIGILPLPDTSITYQWIPATGLSNDTIPNPIATPATSTDYVLLISNGICTDTILQHITVNVFSVFAGNDTTVCSGSVFLHGTAAGGATTWVWSHNHNFTDTLNVSTSVPTATVPVTTSGMFYIYASNQYCNDVDSIYVNVSLVSIQSGNDQTICQGNSTTLSVTNLNPSNPLTYSWSPTSSIISGGNTSSPLVDPSATTTYTVTATDSLGCQKTATVTITVSVISSNGIVTNVTCNGLCDGQITVSPSGGVLPYTYSWNGGQITPTISSLCAGTYTVTVHDGVPCTKVFTFTVTQPPPLILAIADTHNVFCNGICDGWATINPAGGTGPYTYHWSDGQTTQTADSLCAGLYLLTVTDAHGCTNTMSVAIHDTSNFDVYIDSLIPPSCYGGCDGSAIAIASGGTLPYGYQWNNGQTSYIDSLLCAGTNNVTVTEQSGCIRDVYFNLSSPQEIFTNFSNIQPPSCYGLCDGQATANANGGTPSYTYLWNNTQTTQTATGLCAGSYFVTVTDSHDCQKVDTVVITQPTPLTCNTTSSNVPCIEICNGAATANVSGGVPPYSYYWNNGQITNPATNLCEGTYYVTITDANGCHAYDTIVVHDSTTFPPVINAWADDDTIYNSQSTGIHVTHITGASYSWSPPNGLSSSTVPDPTASPTVTTTYIITIEDVYGCAIYDTVTIYVLEVNCDEHGIYVPNAFTPNGDNNNDILYVRSNVISKIYFTIYDRWGEKVFETSDINKGWDGTFRGKPCDPGVFVYYLEVTCIDDQKNLRKGNITLIR